MLLILYLGIILSWAVSYSLGSQKFSSTPKYIEVNPGSEAILECKVLNKGGACIWQKDRKPIGIYPGKYEWVTDNERGDCSLKILNARLDLDDGSWECQVTASKFDALDMLSSDPAQVTVRVAPTTLHMELNSTLVLPRMNLTIQSGVQSKIKCISRFGNPPPKIRWFIGDRELFRTNQTDAPEVGASKKWSSSSILEHRFGRDDHGKKLRCVAMHEAYENGEKEVATGMNVHYIPTVTLVDTPVGDLEEGTLSATMRCVADANPPATIVWKKAGSTETLAIQETLTLKPLSRRISGSYTCEARNIMGISAPKTVEIEVKYAPTSVTIEGASNNQLLTSVGGSVRLECKADGNPFPNFKWIHKAIRGAGDIIVRAEGRFFVLSNVSYEDQGEYICIASNTINGGDRVGESQPVNIRVLGPPKALNLVASQTVLVERGQDATLFGAFCSDPIPQTTMWEINEADTLEAGTGKGRFVAEPLSTMKKPSCYEARLKIQRVELSDARIFRLVVENEKGSDVVDVTLKVTEPVSMAAVIGVIIACIIFLVVVSLCLLYAFKSEGCCTNDEKGDSKTALDIESAKSEYSKSNGKVSSTSSHSSIKSGGGDLRFNDLQLPRASNNGSMRTRGHRNIHGLPSVTPIPSPKSDVISITSSHSSTKDRVDLV
ncbi:hemicentin-2-like isoform X2 [Artemia franciscana]|uniref:hemicentin-2-like isoform X2 n=1 Tax=Artemia franciscana TaxID=6661 RepID=UPI0032D9BCD6